MRKKNTIMKIIQTKSDTKKENCEIIKNTE